MATWQDLTGNPLAKLLEQIQRQDVPGYKIAQDVLNETRGMRNPPQALPQQGPQYDYSYSQSSSAPVRMNGVKSIINQNLESGDMDDVKAPIMDLLGGLRAPQPEEKKDWKYYLPKVLSIAAPAAIGGLVGRNVLGVGGVAGALGGATSGMMANKAEDFAHKKMKSESQDKRMGSQLDALKLLLLTNQISMEDYNNRVKALMESEKLEQGWSQLGLHKDMLSFTKSRGEKDDSYKHRAEAIKSYLALQPKQEKERRTTVEIDPAPFRSIALSDMDDETKGLKIMRHIRDTYGIKDEKKLESLAIQVLLSFENLNDDEDPNVFKIPEMY